MSMAGSGLWLSAVLVFSLVTAEKTPRPFALRDGDVVVFVGDSLTQERGAAGFHPKYPSFVESFVRARYPSLNVSFYNRARANQTAGQAAKRLEGDVLGLAPTVAVLCFGMSEARRTKDNAISAEEFSGHLKTMVRALKESGCRVWMMSPPSADTTRFAAVKKAGTGARLTEVAEVAGIVARQEKIGFVDWYTATEKVLADRRRERPRFRLTNDGVNPLPIGYALGAAELLRAWNAKPYAQKITIDFENRAAECSAGRATVVVDDAKNGTIEVRVEGLPLFWPLSAGKLVQADETWPVDELNRLLVRVINGPETGMLMRQGKREVPVLPYQLTEGINLALTPGFREIPPAVDLLKSIFSKNNVLAQAWLERRIRRPAEPELQQAFETFLRSLAEYADGYRAMAARVPRTFDVTLVLRDITADLPIPLAPAQPVKGRKQATQSRP